MYSIYVDWSKEFESEVWEFVGAYQGYTEEEREDDPDAGMPMMNYAYPIHYFDSKGDRIRKICQETNCTVVYNIDEDRHYLALTGGGMDLSQDIALAYLMATGKDSNPENGYIEWDMIDEIYINSPLSVAEKEFKLILKHLERQTKISLENNKSRLVQIQEKMKEM